MAFHSGFMKRNSFNSWSFLEMFHVKRLCVPAALPDG